MKYPSTTMQGILYLMAFVLICIADSQINRLMLVQKSIGFKLTVTPVKELQVTSMLQCVHKCMNNDGCKSINVFEKSNKNSWKQCFFLDEIEGEEKSWVEAQGWQYIRFLRHCTLYKNVCPADCVCKPDNWNGNGCHCLRIKRFSISSGKDDAEADTTECRIADTTLDFLLRSTWTRQINLRFVAVAINKTDELLFAHLALNTLTIHSNINRMLAVKITIIKGQDSGNWEVCTQTSQTPGHQAVLWNMTRWDTLNTEYYSPDIHHLLRSAITNFDEPKSINVSLDMRMDAGTLMIQNTAHSYDSDPKKAPALIIGVLSPSSLGYKVQLKSEDQSLEEIKARYSSG